MDSAAHYKNAWVRFIEAQKVLCWVKVLHLSPKTRHTAHFKELTPRLEGHSRRIFVSLVKGSYLVMKGFRARNILIFSRHTSSTLANMMSPWSNIHQAFSRCTLHMGATSIRTRPSWRGATSPSWTRTSCCSPTWWRCIHSQTRVQPILWIQTGEIFYIKLLHSIFPPSSLSWYSLYLNPDCISKEGICFHNHTFCVIMWIEQSNNIILNEQFWYSLWPFKSN